MTLSIIAIAISAIALSIAVWNARSDSRAAVAAEDAAVTSRQSADSARGSAEYAAQLTKAEHERDHESRRPPIGEAAFKRVRNEQTREMDLFLEFTLPRGYRAAGDSVAGESLSPLSFDPSAVIESGQLVRVFVGELLDENKHQPRARLLKFRFWPPVAGDPGESWTCPCGRNTDPEGSAHWEWNVPVPKQPYPRVTVLR